MVENGVVSITGNFLVMKDTLVESLTTHDLFNELHRRLCGEAERDNDRPLHVVANRIDESHHDYNELTTPNLADALHDELINMGDDYPQED